MQQPAEHGENFVTRFRKIGLLILLPVLAVNFLAAVRIMRELPEAFPGETLLPVVYATVCAIGFILVWRDERHVQTVATTTLVVIWLLFTQRTWSLVYGPTGDEPSLPIFLPLYAYMPYAYFFFHIFIDLRRAQFLSLAFWATIMAIVFSRLVPDWELLSERYGATSLALYLLVANPMFIFALRLVGILSSRLAAADERLVTLKLEGRLHAEIAASEQRFNNAIRGSRDGVWEWPDIREEAMWWSPRILELLGNPTPAPPASLLSLKRLTHPEDYRHVASTARACLSSGSDLDVECRLDCAGDWRWFAIRGVVLGGDGGSTTGMAGSLQDIHGRKTAEQELMQSHTALYHFAHMAAHDLRAPALRVLRLADLLERRNPHLAEEERNRNALDGLRRQSLYMQGLVDALLEYADADRPRQLVPVDLDRVLMDVCDSLRERAQESGGMIIVEEGLPTVLGDPVRYQQVFQNLVGNGIKFNENAPEVRVRGYVKGDTALIEVADNGVGIDREALDRIFEPLERAGPDPRFSGHGLGLAIVKRVIDGFGGSVRVESAPGAGSRFVLSLPIPDLND